MRIRTSLVSLSIVLTAPVAHADIFNFGNEVIVQLENAPNSNEDGDTVGFDLGTETIDSGTLNLTISAVSAGRGAEWLVFNYQVVGDLGPIDRGGGVSWAINEDIIPTTVPTKLIGEFAQFLNDDGKPFTQLRSIFTDNPFSGDIISNPIPGMTGNGEGNLSLDEDFPAGRLPKLGSRVENFSTVNDGLFDDTSDEVGGFVQAFEFIPQGSATPEISTWEMLMMGFSLLGVISFLRKFTAPRLRGTARHGYLEST